MVQNLVVLLCVCALTLYPDRTLDFVPWLFLHFLLRFLRGRTGSSECPPLPSWLVRLFYFLLFYPCYSLHRGSPLPLPTPYIFCKNRLDRTTAFGSALANGVSAFDHTKNMMSSIYFVSGRLLLGFRVGSGRGSAGRKDMGMVYRFDYLQF
jgi:hypothetical protein